MEQNFPWTTMTLWTDPFHSLKTSLLQTQQSLFNCLKQTIPCMKQFKVTFPTSRLNLRLWTAPSKIFHWIQTVHNSPHQTYKKLINVDIIKAAGAVDKAMDKAMDEAMDKVVEDVQTGDAEDTAKLRDASLYCRHLPSNLFHHMRFNFLPTQTLYKEKLFNQELHNKTSTHRIFFHCFNMHLMDNNVTAIPWTLTRDTRIGITVEPTDTMWNITTPVHFLQPFTRTRLVCNQTKNIGL